MSYPEGITTAQVIVGAAVTFGGSPATVRVWVTPVLGGAATHLVHAPTGVILAPLTEPYTNQLTGTDVATFDVPHVDQPGFVDEAGLAATMWAYRVDVRIEHEGRALTYTKHFQPLGTQSTIDLDLVPDGPVAPALYAPVPAVTSVNGQSGAVVLPSTVVVLTLAQYQALTDPDPAILYAISG